MLERTSNYADSDHDHESPLSKATKAIVSAAYAYSSASLRYLIIGDIYKIWKNRKHFIMHELYERSRTTHIGVGHIGPYWQNCITKLVVVSGSNENLLQVADYGEQHDSLDPAARKAFDIIEKAAGTRSMINMQGLEAHTERGKLKNYLIGNSALEKALLDSVAQFHQSIHEWNMDMSFQNNIAYFCINVIGKCIYGIPKVDMSDVVLIRKVGNLLAENDTKSKEFLTQTHELAEKGDGLLTKYARILMQTNNYIKAQLNLDGTETDEALLIKLKETHGAFGLVVEGNLSALIMMGIYYVHQSDEIKNRLRTECQDFNGLDVDRLRNLSYLNCIYKEALRFLSPTALLVRYTSKPTTLCISDAHGVKSNYSIPKHSVLFALPRRIHHDSRYWQYPDRFDPSRFERDNSQDNHSHSEHFTPFSLGKRSCPAGTGFAEVVFKIAIVESLKYAFTFDKEVEQIPVESMHPRWKNEYFVTEIKDVAENRDLRLCK